MTTYHDLTGRTVIITGGASGIGAAFVRAFAQSGCRVAFLDIQEEAGHRLVDSLRAEALETPLFIACDLLDAAAIRDAVQAANVAFGPASVLVNNAASDQRQEFEEVTPESFDWMMGVNLRHVFFASQAVVPQMRSLGYGSIINMSSIAWMGGAPRMEAYAAAKAAIVGFTNSLARKLGPLRIRVNAIAPGMIITERQRELWFQDESQIAAGVARQALPDLVTPEDVARLALFLGSDASRAITKQCILVDGGLR
jgi:NAD(P)-dependent dehydrogenase (short-subunit alcohol dehydrogenase family)